ncbi:hypothetical protein TNCT_135251 [Trichonephila clavata]|uniref:Uncharacterized protein n=1 Tax=Trichonephila clavata TaxID=2740835 RepID=A0A8X6GN28_TRICU|nr:hypothetical protein TNCT_135251 [Trichonephila clavata]
MNTVYSVFAFFHLCLLKSALQLNHALVKDTRRKHVMKNRNQEDAKPFFLVIIMIRSQGHARNLFMEVVEAMEIDMKLKKNAWIIAKAHKKEQGIFMPQDLEWS